MDQIAQRVIRFDRFVLDLSRGALRGPDADIALRPKAFEVLRYLAENAGRLVSKRELIEAVWPNVFVSDDSLVQCIRELREKLGDNERRLIKTVPRRGYLLDAAIVAAPPDPAPAPELAATDSSALPETAFASAARTKQVRAPWTAAALGLMCVAVGLGYLFWPWQTSVVAPGAIAERTAGFEPARQTFKECDVCPEMVALPAGEFMMGSPEDEIGRLPVEGAPRRVTITRPFAIGKYEVTVDQFSIFLAETGTPVNRQCRLLAREQGSTVRWLPSEASFREPGYPVSGAQPVACMSWHDAHAFVAWLKRRTGKSYRLPTEAEWEFAARAGTTTAFSFGNDTNQLCAYAKFADLASSLPWAGGCRGETTAYEPLEVGRLRPNQWGLFDMHGNVWEWVEDCWTPIAEDIPTDGSAATQPGACEIGVIRGGSWASGFGRVRSAFRQNIIIAKRDQNVGFRVALTLEE